MKALGYFDTVDTVSLWLALIDSDWLNLDQSDCLTIPSLDAGRDCRTQYYTAPEREGRNDSHISVVVRKSKNEKNKRNIISHMNSPTERPSPYEDEEKKRIMN